MRKKLALCALIVLAIMLLASCASTGTTRVDSSTVIDLTGYWNETDVTTVCNKVINDVMLSARIAQFPGYHDGNLPVFILGKISNKSDEHIDTEIISNKLRNAIINSGRADFVASREQKNELRDERADQSIWADEDQAKAVANEDAADFMVQGSVRTIVQKSGNTMVRQYYLYIEIVDVESGRIIFTTEDDSIKKVTKNATTKI